MIPQTFPSVLDSDNRTKMVIYMLSNITGLTKWIDYIPVKSPANEGDLTLVNRYEANGFIYTTSLSDITGKQAWKDYIPVYIDGSATISWSDDEGGYIPMSGLAALLLDFTTMTSLDSRITFSRTSNATITKSDGTIGYAPHNLLTYSEQFDNAAWTKQNVTVAANSTTAPDGTSTADTITSAATNGYIYQTFSAIAGTTYTFSCYVKSVSTATTLQIALLNAAGASGIANVTFTTTGDWTRVSVTGTSATTQTAWVAFGTGGTFSTGETIYVWGAQCEIGSTATTYNPTTVKNLLGYTEAFDNAAWTKSNSFVQTNLLTYSEAFDNAAWTKELSTVTADSVIAPNGYQTADSLNGTNSGNASVYEAKTVMASTTYTWSVYAKAGTVNWIAIGTFDGTVDIRQFFNISTGTLGSSENGTITAATITPVGNGWYRCTCSRVTSVGATSARCQISLASADLTRTGNGTAYIWGAQLVQGSTAGDYRRTDAAALPVFYPNHNGVVCAEKLVEDTASARHRLFPSGVTTVVGGSYTLSVYLKEAERRYAFQTFGDGANVYSIVVDLRTATITSSIGSGTLTNITTSATSVGNGWVRIRTTATVTGTSLTAQFGTSDSATPSYAGNVPTYTGDGTSGIYIFGAQLSDSASLDPYVLNAAAAPSAQAYYGARFDYDPVTLAPKGLLIEEQRVNLCLRSDDLNNASWTAFNSATLTNNSTISPDGTQNADTINFAANATSQYYQLITAGSATYTVSVWAKVASGTGEFRFKTNNGSTDTFSTNQAVTTSWQRFTFTNTTVISQIALVNSSSAVAQSIIFWGVQLEAGAFATSYIPTAASSVTRAADVAVIQGSNFYSWYNQNEGSVYVNSSGTASASGAPVVAINDSTANNQINVGNFAGGTDYGTLFVRYIAATQASLVSTCNPTAFNKAASGYKINDFAGAINNGTALTDSNGITPLCNRMQIGTSPSSVYLNGAIKQISYYNTRLANATLQGLTA